MRVLMTHWNYAPEFSGAALQGHRLSLELMKLGIKVNVLTGTDNPDMVGTDYVDGIKVVRVLRDKSSRLKHLNYGWEMFKHVLRFRHEVDVVHSHGFIAPVNIAAKLAKLPVIQKITNLNVDDPITVRRRKLGHILIKIFNYSRILVPTSRLLERTCRRTDNSQPFFAKVSNGVDPNLFRPVSADEKKQIKHQLGLPRNRTIFLTVGSVTHTKGLDLLINALYELKLTTYDDFLLLVIGPNHLSKSFGLGDEPTDPFTRNLLRSINDKGLFKHIKFLGVQANIHEYMQAADVYIHSSRQEGQPNAILEAMASAIPVVANRLPGITDELLQNGRYGFVVDSENDVEFASAIRVLMKHEKIRGRMGAYSRIEILQNYNLWKIAEKYRSLYYSVVDEETVAEAGMPQENQSLLSILNHIKHK